MEMCVIQNFIDDGIIKYVFAVFILLKLIMISMNTLYNWRWLVSNTEDGLQELYT